MHVSRNLLLRPQDALRIEEIKEQLKWCERAAGTTAAFAMPWVLCFAILIWTVVDYDYSWSPLSWLGPLGLIIVSLGMGSGCHKRRLHIEKRRLYQRADPFVIQDDALNHLKSDLQILANSALHPCVIPEQQKRVLSAYYAAARELMHLDSSDQDASQSEAIENFRKLRSALRTIGDEVAGERERNLL
ncbi:MAG TPA: hypothetical protein VLG09_05260 [Candidatus Saccharimonadales bacterium]|nr:hypothetical protein [Candidatus Saccharimonadales bacterium]